MKLLSNKQGNFSDIPFYLLSALTIGLVLIFTTIIMTNVNDGFQSNNNIPNVSKAGGQAVFDGLTSGGDYIVPAIFLGFLIFSLISARLIPSSSKFAIIGVLVLIFMPIVAMIINNFWDGFSTQSTIVTTLLYYPITKFFLDQMVIFTLIYSVLVGWALYAKDQ